MCFSHRGKNKIHPRQDFLHTAQQLKHSLEVLPWRQGGLPCPDLKGSFSCCNFLVSSAAQSLADKPADKQLSRKIRWLTQSLNDLRGARCTYEGSGEWDIPATAFKDWSATNVEPKQHPPKPAPSVLERDPGLWKASGTFAINCCPWVASFHVSMCCGTDQSHGTVQWEDSSSQGTWPARTALEIQGA